MSKKETEKIRNKKGFISDIFEEFPQPDELRKIAYDLPAVPQFGINAHIHTPYSFSSFSDMDHVFRMALTENIRILGINDFYTADGFADFARLALANAVFPLFNMEFIGLLKEERNNGIRVNDPNNPGRTYLCAKGLKFPFFLDPFFNNILKELVNETQLQIESMIGKTNSYFSDIGLDLIISMKEIKTDIARDLVRERHIARAVRVKIIKTYPDEATYRKILNRILNTDLDEAVIRNDALLENMIRSELLKKGGPGFVEEKESSFLPVEQLVSLIRNGNGIPCYPVLLDDPSGNITEFEENREYLYNFLISAGIFAVELIPARNDIKVLKDFVNFFHDKKFIITFGTEHNTPEMLSMSIVCRNKEPLNNSLKNIFYEGVSIVAAHQYLTAIGEKGYLDDSGAARIDDRNEFVLIGKGLIETFFKNYR